MAPYLFNKLTMNGIGLSLNLFVLCFKNSNFLCFLRVMLERYSEGGNQRENFPEVEHQLQTPCRYAIHGLQVTQAQVPQGSRGMMYTLSLGYASKHVSGCSPPGPPVSEKGLDVKEGQHTLTQVSCNPCKL